MKAKAIITEEDFSKEQLLGLLRPTEVWVAIIEDEWGDASFFISRTRAGVDDQVGEYCLRSWDVEYMGVLEDAVEEEDDLIETYFYFKRESEWLTVEKAFLTEPMQGGKLYVAYVRSRLGRYLLADTSQYGLVDKLADWVRPRWNLEDEEMPDDAVALTDAYFDAATDATVITGAATLRA